MSWHAASPTSTTNPLTSEVEAFHDLLVSKNQHCADLDLGRVPAAPRATSLEDVLAFTVYQLKDILSVPVFVFSPSLDGHEGACVCLCVCVWGGSPV